MHIHIEWENSTRFESHDTCFRLGTHFLSSLVVLLFYSNMKPKCL